MSAHENACQAVDLAGGRISNGAKPERYQKVDLTANDNSPPKNRTLSRRGRKGGAPRIASIRLSEIVKLLRALSGGRHLFDASDGYAALADALASCAPFNASGGRRFCLDAGNLRQAALKAGLDPSDERLEVALASRVQKVTWVRQFDPDALAKMFNVTENLRRKLRLTQIGAINCSRERRAAEQAKSDRQAKSIARRAAGVPLIVDALSRKQPWAVLGISRRTWERRRVATAAGAKGICRNGGGDDMAGKELSQRRRGRKGGSGYQQSGKAFEGLGSIAAPELPAHNKIHEAGASPVDWCRGSLSALDGYAHRPPDWRASLRFYS